MKSFRYHAPATLSDAANILAARDDAAILAGGMTLLPTMKQGLAAPGDLIDLAAIQDMKGIVMEGEVLVIGAMTRHADVAGSSLVQERLPALARLASRIGDQQVRHRGTIGGSIANNDPAADYPAALLALDATIVTNQRSIRADDFFVGMFETALQSGEIVTAVRFPPAERAAYAKFPNPASRYAIAGVFVAEAGGTVRVAVTGAGSSVFRASDIEAALAADYSVEALQRISIDAEELMSDIHADREYRAHLVMVMARRAVAGSLNLSG